MVQVSAEFFRHCWLDDIKHTCATHPQMFSPRTSGKKVNNKKNHPFYGHYTGQPALAAPPVKNWRISLVQSFTADNNQHIRIG